MSRKKGMPKSRFRIDIGSIILHIKVIDYFSLLHEP